MIWLGMYLGGCAAAISLRMNADLEREIDDPWWQSLVIVAVWPPLALATFGCWVWKKAWRR